jgi:DNA-binding NarL/FixJ family response regulator
MIRLLVADDHLLFRQGLRRMLADEADFEVVAEAGTSAEAVAAVSRHDIHVAILDLSMPGHGWADMIRQVRMGAPRVHILALSMHGEESLVLAALKAGAHGYLTKEDAAEDVASAVRKLAQGGRYVCPQLAERITFGVSCPDARPPHARLSTRELEIMEMLSAGKRGSEIASALCLSEKTVSTHKVNLLRKLNLNNSAELVVYALNHGLGAMPT